MAIPLETIVNLPLAIQDEVEKWESDFVDISSMHVCFSENHPGGYIKTNATFSDGRNFRTWGFGKRQKLPKTKGLAVWGVSSGEDLAIFDESYKIEEYDQLTGHIELAGSKITYDSLAQRRFVISEIRKAEKSYSGKRGSIYRIQYPIALASSSSSDALIDTKYELNTTLATYDEALAVAMAKNGYLLQIEDAAENELLQEWLLSKANNNELTQGIDEDNVTLIPYVWLGATDNDDTNGTVFDEDANLTTQTRIISANEGDWKWLNGASWVDADANWEDSPHIDDPNKDFAALDWNDTNGTWADLNKTARLPFVIEYDTKLPTIDSDLKGIRKILVVPARFLDETTAWSSTNQILTNELGQELLAELQVDAYEPIARETIEQAMENISAYYNRISDGELVIIPVISQTVTLPFPRYEADPNLNEQSHFDSDGVYTGLAEIIHTELPAPDDPGIEGNAMILAASLSDDWNYEGPAFIGVSSVSLVNSKIDTNFTSPPSVTFEGGGVSHPQFKPARAEAILDDDGDVMAINLLEPGAYYQSAPQIFLDGVDYTSEFTCVVESLLISKVAISNYSAGAAGLGFIGGAGAHVKITNGTIPESTIAHEIGHNFGLWHANRYLPRGEHALSDDADMIEYGNPFSVMGQAKDIVNGGDLTVGEQAALNEVFEQKAGYSLGNTIGDDVVNLSNSAMLSNNSLEENSTVDNTFRIYRSNYGSPPRFLKETASAGYELDMPDEELAFLNELNGSPYKIKIEGSGEEANGTLVVGSTSATLFITDGGRGFVAEPTIKITDENETERLSLNSSWIRVANGRDFNETAKLSKLCSRRSLDKRNQNFWSHKPCKAYQH